MENFLEGLTGEIILPFEPFIYNEARQGFNSAIQQYPLIIVYCLKNQDVINATLWSRRHGVNLRVRNGGHNYEGYSNGDCTLVIDVSKMNDMFISEKRGQLTVQAGVSNMQVYKFLGSYGYPFPGGTCPNVGVSGYSLGGGWGLSCRYFGLGCDSLEKIELVNYEGIPIIASQECNEDLFWACRGAGGGNFGVIVSMTFRLPPKITMVTLIEIDYRNVTKEEQEVFLKTWQDWFHVADNRMTLIARIYQSEEDGLAMLVRGIFYGTPREGKEMIKGFLILENVSYNIEYMSFLEAVTIIGENYPASEKFASVSRFATRYFSEKEVAEIVDLIREPPKGSVFAGVSMYALGGKVSEVEKSDTAYFYRNAKYILWLETIWEENRYARSNREWIKKQFPTFRDITLGSYVNFPNGGLLDYLEEYYGKNKERLICIKLKYDPLNVFSFPQGILKEKENMEETPLQAVLRGEYEKSEKKSKAVNYRGFRYVAKREE